MTATATKTLPTFSEAAATQHLYGSYYTVWLVAPGGTREYLGYTARKTGTGLCRPSVQGRVQRFPDADALTFRKTAGALLLSNGYRITFGGTIRQEAQA
jgi:hypothetical protein